MSILDTFEQTPNERKYYTIKYGAWLGDGELLDTVNVSASDPSLLVQAYITVDKLNIVVTVGAGGSDNDQINVIVLASTNTSQVKEDCLLFLITAACT